MTLLFAWRYFKAKKTTNAINIISWISILAIAVGSAALILVLSVFNGFEDLVKNLYADFYADVRVAPARGKMITLTTQQLQKIGSVPGVDGISLIAEEKAVLVNDEYQSIIYLKGVDQAYTRVSGLQKHVVKGDFKTGSPDEPLLVLGAGIENAVGVAPGGLYPLTVYLPNRNVASFSGSDALHSYNAYVSGTFSLQQDFDNKYAITNIGFLKYMLDMQPDEYSAAEIRLLPGADVEKVTEQIARLLPPGYIAQTRYQQNQSLYAVMQMEKWVIYGILSIILVVAAFNMIGALTMLVLEKQKDIAVLNAMGAGSGYIQRIFLGEGLVLAGLGGGSGMIIAATICYLQMEYKLLKLGGGSFIINHYPVKMLPQDFALVTLTILLISVLAAWLPARKAVQLKHSLKS